MAHEMKIKYGVIINETQVITGVTINTGLTENSNFLIPTERAVKTYVDNAVSQFTTTLSGLSDVSLNNLQSGEYLVYNGTSWVNSGVSFDLSNYYTKTETNSYFTSATTTATLSSQTWTAIGTNTTNISTLSSQTWTAIGDSTSSISTLSSQTWTAISTNTTNISTLSSQTWTAIGTNTTNISTLSSQTWTEINNRYTKAEADANFLSANTQYVDLTSDQFISGNKTFLGNVTVSGTTTFLHTQNLSVVNNIILINSGETGSGVTAGYAGIYVDRGLYPDYIFVFDEIQDNFRVGESGQTQAVATREDNPTHNYVAVWNSALTMFVTVDINTLVDLTNYYTKAETNSYFTSATTTATLSSQTWTAIGTNTTNISTLSSQTWTAIGTNTTNINTLSSQTWTAISTNTTNINTLSSQTWTAIGTNTTNINTLSSQTWTAISTNTTNISTLSSQTWTAINDRYTKAETDSYFTSATTTATLSSQTWTAINDRYTKAESNANFLSANTSYYTQAQANANFLSANTNIFKAVASTNLPGYTVDTFLNTFGKGVIWHYTITDGTNMRTGTINAVYNTGSDAEFNDTSTKDIGNVNCELTVVNDGTNVELNIDTISGTWSIYVTRILLG